MPAAADVENGISDNHHVLWPETGASVVVSTLDGQCWQLVAVGMIAAKSSERELGRDAGSSQLGVGCGLKIAGHQPKLHCIVCLKMLEQQTHTGQQRYIRRQDTVTGMCVVVV